MEFQESGKRKEGNSCYLLGHQLFHRFLDEQTLRVSIERFKSVVSVKREHIYSGFHSFILAVMLRTFIDDNSDIQWTGLVGCIFENMQSLLVSHRKCWTWKKICLLILKLFTRWEELSPNSMALHKQAFGGLALIKLRILISSNSLSL